MSFNRSLLSQITKDLNKKPSKPKVPKNQWQHPGEITNIPSNNITMDAVSYPVLGVPNFGQPQMMYPDQQYHFPEADNVTEYPMMAKGGYTVTRSNDRKGKTHKVTGPDGTVKYFGDSKLGQHPKDPQRKAAFYARHKKNLDGNPYFRAFARATWQTGGQTDSTLENIAEVFDPTGITSWDDVYRSAVDPNAKWYETGIEIAGALPLLGKLGKLTKAGIHLKKYKGLDKVLFNALPKNATLSKTIDAIGTAGRGSDAYQAIQQLPDNKFLPFAEGGQTRNEREMVNGIADILSQVRDPQNRAEIAKQMMSDFRRDNVTYNPQDFMNMAELKQGGEMIRRADGSYSRRGLWDNIRANKGSGKKPTKEMLEQERKIKSKMQFGGLSQYQTAGQVIKPKKGYIDLSEYGYNALDAEGIAKAEELNKMYPGSKFVCTAKGCADIARQIGDAKGYDFGRNNAWGYRGNIPELYVNPGYKEELEAGKPLHNPKSYAFPEEVKKFSGVLVGLNRKDNFDGKMAKTTAEANDSKDYANRMLYAGNNAGHEHVGYFGDGMMYHGTASSKDHPAFYVIDNPEDGIALPGISKYNVVNAMGEPGLMDRAASTFNSVTGSVADAFNDFKAKFIKQEGGTAYNEMVQRLVYKKKGGLLKAQVGKQNPFFPNLNPAQEAADAQAQLPADTNPFGVYDVISQEGVGIAGQMKSKILKENATSTTDQKKEQKSNPMLNPFFALNAFIGGANLNAQAKREEANRQMLRSQNATWNQQYDSMMNRGDYSQGPSSYGLYKPDQMSVPGFFADGGLTSLDVALGMAPTMVPNLTPDLNYAAFDMPATRTPEAATPESYNVAPTTDVTGLELDPDKMLEAIAGTESGSKKGQSKVGMRTKLIGDGGKRASASGTFQITDGTLKQIYKKDQFNDVFPTFNAFKAAFDKDPQVEYQAARSLAVDHIKNYGVYALGAWYYPDFASRAAKGDMSVMNQIPRADYGNKMTWGQNFNKNLTSYKKALGKSQFGGEMELTMEEIQQIKAMGGKVEFC
jgi:hypothetical protein